MTPPAHPEHHAEHHPEQYAPTLDLLCELLGTDTDRPPAELLHHARTVSFTLPPLLLSAAVHAGRPTGTGSDDELRRHRTRLATYDRIAAAVAETGTRVVKGPALARFQPPWAVRTCGDLDLLAPGEAELWQAARRISELLPVHDIQLTLIGSGPGRHLMVGLGAPSPEPWLDPELKIELATFAYPGDWETVPLRAAMPEHDATAQLLAVAEERFQRPFTVRDVLDCAAVLTSAEAPAPIALAETAHAWHLAPELLELTEFARSFPTLAPLVDEAWQARLAPAAATERARRAGLRPDRADEDAPPGESGPERTRRRLASGGPVPARLADGYPVFGIALQVDHPFAPADRAVLHTVDDSTVLTTPLGAFLLVSRELVDPAAYRRAVDFATALAAGDAATDTPREQRGAS
ncbi:hypothetical protein AB0D08_32860 [Kitasatospora sp. NPDC048540]|uniref:hypothetical protein n=1 Tax=unclassified Kitasatospora TaxID=2633591 RepID=UPI00053AA4A8|nr:hypothetical protein [Kitasatospora sp. MBT63]